MQNSISRSAAAAALVLSSPAWAINGFFAHGYGTQSKGMAGVGVALALDGLSPATNPAALVRLDDRTDVGFALFNPTRGYSVDGEPTGACASSTQCTFGLNARSHDSGRELFTVPSFGMVRNIDGRAAWGLSIYANGGLNTEYHGSDVTLGAPTGTVPPGQAVTLPGVYGGGNAGIDLTQLFVAPSYAHRMGEDGAWGIAPIFGAQRFRAEGLGAFAPYSSKPRRLTDQGYDYAFGGGVRIGLQYRLHPLLDAGASWQSRIYMSNFKEYAGLFAGNGNLDIPPTYTIGLASHLTPAFTFSFDVQRIENAKVRSVGNPLLPGIVESRLGEDRGPGFGWNNMTVYKAGASYASGEGRTWRLGYSYTELQTPSSEILFSILAPSVARHHVTAGMTQKLSQGHQLSFSAMYAPPHSLSGRNPLDPAQKIEVEARIIEFEVGYTWGATAR